MKHDAMRTSMKWIPMRMPDARTIASRRGEKIDELREIVRAALLGTDSGKLYNTMR